MRCLGRAQQPLQAIEQTPIDLLGLFQTTRIEALIQGEPALEQILQQTFTITDPGIGRAQGIEQTLGVIGKRTVCLLYTSPSPRDS